MIARTGNRLHNRWAVVAGQGPHAYVFRYAVSRGWAKFYAQEHPANCASPQVCPECNGAKILLSGDILAIYGDECGCCLGEGIVADPQHWACSEIDFASVNPLLAAAA